LHPSPPDELPNEFVSQPSGASDARDGAQQVGPTVPWMAGAATDDGATGNGPPAGWRMPRRRRNQVCIAIIAIGLVNYLAYTVSYHVLGGDAPNGHREAIVRADGSVEQVYYVRGHFIHSLTGRERQVSRAAWVYSYVHSISVPLTSGAMILCMLVLARPHILATMRGSPLSGRLVVGAFAVLVLLIALWVTARFVWDFVGAVALLPAGPLLEQP